MIENFLTIDTETTRRGENMPFGSVFDIGWTITNRQGQVLCERSYMVKEFKYEALNKRRAFLIDSGFLTEQVYLQKILDNTIKVASWSNIIGQLKKDSKKHNVEYISAYNLTFDFNVINKTNFFLTGKELNFFENFFLIDLYHVCAYTVLNTPHYKKVASEKGWVSEKGNILTKAETTYRYIFNKHDYIEEHTALADTKDEAEILHHLLDNWVEFIPLQAYKMNSQAWRIVNEKKEKSTF